LIPRADTVADEDLLEIDAWALAELDESDSESARGYDATSFTSSITRFTTSAR